MNYATPSSDSLPQGFIPVMLTPFLKSGAVDYVGLRALTDFYLEAGATGLFANCLSSEMFELSEQERLDVTQTVVDQVAGRVPVVATGTFPGSVAEQAAFTKRIYDTGVQAVIVITGLMAAETESDEVFTSRVLELISLTNDIPLGLYECPVPYKRLINSEILETLMETGRIVYHKDTSLDLDEVKRRIAVADGYKFGLYDAYMVNAVSSLRAGAAGLSCIQGNIFPELVVWICDHYNDPAMESELAEVQQFLEDSMEIVHSAYPTIAKYSLKQRGFPISIYTRREVDTLTPELQSRMDQLLEDVDRIQTTLGITSIFKKNLVK
ncbi:dihydrodipicolinate synthase family protein [Dyadobacter chenwenxiniae]|uniref:Dihydrodipicolinate synthase family protein n=1 Tax=Dyadobacter chenwenxiniae TaxID=2906456 RepID=A0A9X1PLB1_9BACT|nr:dihydrodipicolinate synthase family protein [Dyadobacter chenwenxiniae]MCF0062039.1 dihydrodipicolinate synthase family protein [Dyadobacter chenwenxiniae]UON86398.1 dihydrodipicolinate synthase family protein [Dyadobacter chenwenxiniae]